MLIDNITRAFGSDVLFLASCAAPVLAVYVAVRWWRLRSRRTAPVLVPLVEAFAIGYAVCLAAVTLIPQGTREEYPRVVVWGPFTSDLGHPADRTEILGNLVLYLPLVLAITLFARPHRPMRFGGMVAALLPTMVEMVQYVAVPGRVAAVQDGLVGAAGGVLGVVVAAGLRRLRPFRTFQRPVARWRQRSRVGATSGP